MNEHETILYSQGGTEEDDVKPQTDDNKQSGRGGEVDPNKKGQD